MNLFAIAGLSCGISCTILALIALIFGNAKIHRILALFNTSVAIWGYGCFIVGIVTTEPMALLGWRFGQAGGIFIATFFYHMVCMFCGLQRKRTLIIVYLWSLFFLYFCFFTNWLFAKTRFIYSVYYNDATWLYALLVFSWLFFVCLSFFELLRFLPKTRGLKRTQTIYIIFGFLTGFVGGASTLIPMFRVDFSPFGNFTIPIYCLIATYAILRYRLLDIKIAGARLGIFGIVYLVLLGVPFWIGYKFGQWQYATWVMLFSATLGPFLYNYLRRQAEERLLKEERKISNSLIQASSGMTTIRDLRKLLGLIAHIVSRAIKAQNTKIYLLEPDSNQYILKVARFKHKNPLSINIDDPLIEYLRKNKSPLVCEEVKNQADTENNDDLKRIASRMKDLSASLIIPMTVQESLLGFLILGERKSSGMYTPDLINSLAVLSNQAALAIENARFYENEKKNQALLYQSATLAQMGTLADSMGHQIKNHIQKMMSLAGAEAGMLEEFLQQGLSYERAIELLKTHLASFKRIEEQGKVGGELIASISKFSKLPREDFKDLSVAEIFKTANDILQFKIKFDRVDYVVDIPDNLPLIYAHPILSEAFLNLLDNAYDAVIEREERLNEPGYRGKIIFQARHSNSEHIEIKICDNGIGIDKNILQHLFLPFYTTKATANKGTGLGLYVIKGIVDNHKGRLDVESERLKGTTFIITLAIKQASR